jgi:hypothetical protein
VCQERSRAGAQEGDDLAPSRPKPRLVSGDALAWAGRRAHNSRAHELRPVDKARYTTFIGSAVPAIRGHTGLVIN